MEKTARAMEIQKVLERGGERLQAEYDEVSAIRDALEGALGLTRITRHSGRIGLLLCDWSLNEMLGIGWEHLPATEADAEGAPATAEEERELGENTLAYRAYLANTYLGVLDTIDLLRKGEATLEMEEELHRTYYCVEQLCYCYARLTKRLGLW